MPATTSVTFTKSAPQPSHPPWQVPTLQPSNELCIQKIDRLDVRCSRLIPTDQTLQSVINAPVAIGCLPPRSLLALPALANTVRSSAAALITNLSSGEEEVDPKQLDSPISRNRLTEMGIDDPRSASPGLLRRVVGWLTDGSARLLSSSPSASAPPPAPRDDAEEKEKADAIQSSIRMNALDQLNLVPPQPSALASAALQTLVSPSGPALPPFVAMPTPPASPSFDANAADATSGAAVNSTGTPPTLDTSSEPPAVSTELKEEIAAKRVPPPAVLVPPPAAKRMKADGEAKHKVNARSRQNPWICTCLPVWPTSGGRPWHQAACERQKWVASGGVHLPALGTQVKILACAGARAGQVWECTRVHKDGWKRVS